MHAAQQRRIERAVHLVAGVVLAVYVYLPIGDALADIIRWMVVPVLVCSGMAMWQATRVRRALQRRRARVVSSPHAP
jgi:uncharacterized protein involved in cysteine biosynthesis